MIPIVIINIQMKFDSWTKVLKIKENIRSYLTKNKINFYRQQKRYDINWRQKNRL